MSAPASAQTHLPGVQVGTNQPQSTSIPPEERLFSPKPQNLFEALFPDLIQQRIQRERALHPPVAIEKVSAPKYYDYAAIPLVKIDLSALVPTNVGSVHAAPVAAGPEDMNAVDGNGANDGANVMSPPVDPARQAFDRVAARFGGIHVMAEPDIAKAVVRFYSRQGKLLWLDADLQPNARARSVLPVLADAASWGLQPADYRVDLPVQNADPDITAEDAARFEVQMTARVIRYAMDAFAGRVDPDKISGYHDFPEQRITAEGALNKLLDGGLPANTLVGLNPHNRPFMALKAELARLSKEAADKDVITFPDGTLIKPGDTNAEIGDVIKAIGKKGSEELRSKFADVLNAPAPDTYTPEVVDLVKAFQKEQGLGVDGVVGRNTISHLSDISVADKRHRVILAMERLRWHPHTLGATRVVINQPAFHAYFIRNEKTVLDTKVIVGKVTNQTTFFYDTIETVEYNPYWGIPRSILVNEYLPKLRQNPAYLDESGYIVTDAKGRQIPSASIDWWQVGSDPHFDVRQLPGEENALGELKILFPNKHAIYMHDTPNKSLFSRDVRAFSHGCVRLQKPREMAAAVLDTTVAHVKEKLAEGHNSEDVPHQIPVYVAYFTAWPDDHGKVGYYNDIYGRDDALTKALQSTESVRGVTS